MPLDPSIILNAGRQPRRNPLAEYAGVMQIQQAQQEMAALEDERSRRNALAEAAKGAVGPDGRIDYGALSGAMIGQGDIEGALKIDEMSGKRSKAASDAETAEYNAAQQKLGLMAQVFGGAKTPESYARGRQFLAAQGIDTSQIPEQFDPTFVQDATQQALTAKERLADAWKEREFGLDERRTKAAELTANAAAQGKLGTTVNTGNNAPQVGTIPPGYQMTQVDGGWRMAPIPGGPVAAENAALQDKADARREKEEGTANIVLQDIRRAKDMVTESPILTAGFLGPILSNWGGSNAANVEQLIDTISANISFDALNQMRQSSPTGGALGAVTERELALLSATAGSLSQKQSASQLIRNLERLERQFQEVIHGKAPGPSGAQVTPLPENLPPDVQQLWPFMTEAERAAFR